MHFTGGGLLQSTTHIVIDGSIFFIAFQRDSPGTEDEVGDAHRLFLLDVGDVPHHDVDEGVLHQREEHEHRAAGHEHVDGLEEKI